jgi:hypothetical protein
VHDRGVRWLVIVAVACGPGLAPKQRPLQNDPRCAAAHRPGSPPYIDEVVDAVESPRGALRGVLVEGSKEEPAVGVTVVVANREHAPERAVISDENGLYDVPELEPGTWSVTYYRVDRSFTHDVTIHAGKLTVERVRELERLDCYCAGECVPL